jgi:hypothetical protein
LIFFIYNLFFLGLSIYFKLFQMPLLSFSTFSPRQQPQSSEKKKIKIKPMKSGEKKQGEKCQSKVPTTEVPTTPIRRKIRIVIKNPKQDFQKRVSYNDIVPPASMIYNPSQNNFYCTNPPPQRCCRFFIENRHCFLREGDDNTCISPTSRTVIGFWNGKVGRECKLLPIQDDDEQEIVHEQISAEFVSSSSSSSSLQPKSISNTTPLVVSAPSPNPSPTPSPSPSPTPSPRSKSRNPKPKMVSIQKPRFVSDAQRARIASEPVALLREKLAKQYGIKK